MMVVGNSFIVIIRFRSIEGRINTDGRGKLTESGIGVGDGERMILLRPLIDDVLLCV